MTTPTRTNLARVATAILRWFRIAPPAQEQHCLDALRAIAIDSAPDAQRALEALAALNAWRDVDYLYALAHDCGVELGWPAGRRNPR